jgi:hypothetical protein
MMRRHAVWAACGVLALSSLAHADAAAPPGPWPDLSAPAAVEAVGATDAAVIVSIEKYAFVPSVRGAHRNAQDWYKYFVDSRKVPSSRVHALRDKDGTRDEILAAVEKASREVGEGGTLWFVFIGHGAPTKDGEGSLVGVDAQQTATSLETRSVRQSELRAAYRAAGGPRVVEVLDACFSGRSGGGESLAPGLQPLVVAGAISAALATDNVTTLSAGANDQFAGPLPKSRRPAFSYLALGALRGWGDSDHDGKVTAREAVEYARGVLTFAPIGRTQTPQVAGRDPDGVLAAGGREFAPNFGEILLKEDELDFNVEEDGMSMAQRAARRRTFRAVGWTGMGLGAAALATGAVFAWQASVEGAKFNDLCPGGDCTANSSAANSAYDTAKTNATIGNVGIYAGVGLMAVGSAFLLAAPELELPTGNVSIGPGWVGYRGQF